ncbi:MAG: hypothetical protein J5822_06410 [Eubacteriaceae bacterium]|nr:hypothetical protein [Eubacteriaceae bacterium]
MRKLTILVDMDDTIEQLLCAWIRSVNEKFGTCVAYDDIKSWDVSEAFPGLSHDDVYDVILEDDFWDSVEPVPGAAEALRSFMEEGHSVYIVTATPYQSVKAKMEKHLFRYFPFISWDQLIITSRKQMIMGDVLIDDAVHNLIGGSYRKILMDSANNRAFDTSGTDIVRCMDWDQAREIIAGMAAED